MGGKENSKPPPEGKLGGEANKKKPPPSHNDVSRVSRSSLPIHRGMVHAESRAPRPTTKKINYFFSPARSPRLPLLQRQRRRGRRGQRRGREEQEAHKVLTLKSYLIIKTFFTRIVFESWILSHRFSKSYLTCPFFLRELDPAQFALPTNLVREERLRPSQSPPPQFCGP